MDIFISYRREGGLDFSGRLYEKLVTNNYTVFYDLEGMKAGRFDTQLYKKIERSDNFVLILSPHSLDRCDKEDDWVRLEIEKALELKKNIILILMQGFKFPDNLPPSLEIIKNFQGIWYFYTSTGFNTTYSQLLLFLKDKEGNPLKEVKQKRTSNTYYETIGMKEEEKKRIINDHKICKEIESKIFEEILTNKENISVFNPAVYEITSTMNKYQNFPQISNVYGFVCNKAAAEEANNIYGKDGHHFYVGNMEDIDFCNKMDLILEENDLDGFDFVDLTLILKDSNKPFEKLSSIVERLNANATIYVRELDDDMVIGYPDVQNKFAHLVELLKVDKYAGNRNMGRSVYTYLKRTGATKVKMINTLLSTSGMNAKKRRMLFETYFSYLEPEIDDLIEQNPDNELYLSTKAWLKDNYSQIGQTVLSSDFLFVSGFMFFYGVYEDL
jgi:hypothetical protein